VFEIDAIKDHKILFPIVTIIIMEVFINKMRRLKGIRKLILIEEAWKAIAKREWRNTSSICLRPSANSSEKRLS
jgi:hypothetical protein